MDLAAHRRNRKQYVVATNALRDVYQHNVSFYTVPPTNEIVLQEFEELAIERLQLLRILEQASQKGLKPFSNEWKESIYSDLIKQNLKRYAWLAKSTGASEAAESDLQIRKADHISHFILRLAYCRSTDLRRWFLSREIEWFKLRFLQLSPSSVEKFLELNNLTYTPISSEEKSRLHEQLYQSTAGVYVIDAVDFYKVPYTDVVSLIKCRKVYVEKGFAYVPSFELVTCIIGIFRTQLNAALTYTCRRLPLLDDERINVLINNLHKIYTGKSYTQRSDGSTTSPSNLDEYSRQHYPLCMRTIHETFRSTHHMKHNCRMQYGTFTKAIGLSLDDAVAFWREEFSKKMDPEKFEKTYMYGIKHMYGKVGRMTDYSPYSCLKIINMSVGPGEHHGCPFKCWDSAALRSKLMEVGIGSEGTNEILETASKGHYQIACSKYFERTHGQPSKNVINHPNEYFEESFALSKDPKDTSAKESRANKLQTSKTPHDVAMDVDDVNWDEEM